MLCRSEQVAPKEVGKPRRFRLLDAIARLDIAQASFERRGFPQTRAARRLEAVGRHFISGYNLALRVDWPEEVLGAAAEADASQGFVLEGAAMGFAVRDALALRSRRLARFLELTADENPYLPTVGVGWAMARLRWRRRALLAELRAVIAPLAFDGWGFHDCYFRPARLSVGPPRTVLQGPLKGCRQFWDQGAGRALWFISGADISIIAKVIEEQAAERRPDLASGLGLAATYAGGAEPAALVALKSCLAPHSAWLAQGAAFGLAARARAGRLTEEAVKTAACLTRADPEEILLRVKRCLPGRLEDPDRDISYGEARYVAWRMNLADSFRGQEGASYQ